MGRFFFDLQGKHSASDPTGLPFDTELNAFRAAQRLAAELWSTRPPLARQYLDSRRVPQRDGEAYYVSV